MPRRRPAFSLLELALTMGLVVLLAAAASLVLVEEPTRADRVVVRSLLKDLQQQVQARALGAPDYHFASLAEALGVRAPPVDPWGQPFLLLHQGPRAAPGAVMTLAGGADAAFGAGGGTCARLLDQPHMIMSMGPPEGLDPGPDEDRILTPEDLWVLVRIGRPKAALPAPEAPPGNAAVPAGPAILRLYDHSAVDGDRVAVELDGLLLAAGLELSAPPGAALAANLAPGSHAVRVQALNTGRFAPNTVALETGGSSVGTVFLGLYEGEEYLLNLAAQ